MEGGRRREARPFGRRRRRRRDPERAPRLAFDPPPPPPPLLPLGLFATLLTLLPPPPPPPVFRFSGGADVSSSSSSSSSPRSARVDGGIAASASASASARPGRRRRPRCYRYRWERAWRNGRGRIRARAIRVRARSPRRGGGVAGGESMVEGRRAVGGDRGEREAAVEVRLDLRHERLGGSLIPGDVRADHREAAGEERGAARGSAPASEHALARQIDPRMTISPGGVDAGPTSQPAARPSPETRRACSASRGASVDATFSDMASKSARLGVREGIPRGWLLREMLTVCVWAGASKYADFPQLSSRQQRREVAAPAPHGPARRVSSARHPTRRRRRRRDFARRHPHAFASSSRPRASGTHRSKKRSLATVPRRRPREPPTRDGTPP